MYTVSNVWRDVRAQLVASKKANVNHNKPPYVTDY